MKKMDPMMVICKGWKGDYDDNFGSVYTLSSKN